jgi:hypothetical protein
VNPNEGMSHYSTYGLLGKKEAKGTVPLSNRLSMVETVTTGPEGLFSRKPGWMGHRPFIATQPNIPPHHKVMPPIVCK